MGREEKWEREWDKKKDTKTERQAETVTERWRRSIHQNPFRNVISPFMRLDS